MQIVVSNTNLVVMFKACDGVLKKYGPSAKFEVPESIKGQSSLSVLKYIFGGTSFYISNINELAKLHKVEFSQEHRDWMQTLHCVKFEDMHPDTREYLFAVCVEYFKPVISMTYAAGTE